MSKPKKEKPKSKLSKAKNERPKQLAIRMGIPIMDALWKKLNNPQVNLTKEEEVLYKRLGKALQLLSLNPRYPSLNSHEISTLTQKYGKKVFESYIENNTPSAGRIFWVYGDDADIIILALEPHPEPNAYGRIKLDSD